MVAHLLRMLLVTLTAFLVWPALILAGSPAVLVNPHVQGRGNATTFQEGITIATTIQEGIALVDPGGTVMVLPGTYDEAIVIDKGLTLEASGPVIIAPPRAPAPALTIAIRVATPEPVTIRNAALEFNNSNGGIIGEGGVDVTVERVRMTAVDPLPGAGFLVAVSQNAVTNREDRAPARLSVRESFLDGTLPPEILPTTPVTNVVGIRVQGDVDALLEGNVIRRTGACIAIFMRTDFSGETNADILDNDLDECHPPARLGSLIVQAQVVPTRPVTAIGAMNILGNTIRNTSASCLPTTAIVQSFGTGRIERNRVLGVVQQCAITLPTRTPGAIWIGSLIDPNAPPPSSVVRFNDIEGNAYAGLRVGINITTPLDARCNWWGSASGPSGAGPGTGDAVVLESGAVAPDFTPWAFTPIAETDAACP